jgi:hypothetical protein
MTDKLIKKLEYLIEKKYTSATQLAAILNISKDTIYKRLSGTSPFLLQEAFQLQSQFNFSLDELNTHYNQDKVHFTSKVFAPLATPEATLQSYVDNLYADLLQVQNLGVSNVYYAAKDLPLFCFFSSSILASFKLYFWYITLFEPKDANLKFKSNWLPESIIQKALDTYELYTKIPSTEIWNYETINSTLHQITYCRDLGLINKEDSEKLITALLKYIDNLNTDCELKSKNGKATFTLYLNDILLLDNTVLFETQAISIFYLPFQTLNFLSNTNPQFNVKIKEWFLKQIKKSEEVSNNNEKIRIKLMNAYRKNINNYWDAH